MFVDVVNISSELFICKKVDMPIVFGFLANVIFRQKILGAGAGTGD